MSLSLPPNLQQFANHQLASGKYASLDDMLLAGLQALAERELIYQGRFEELRQIVLSGAMDAERGDLLDATPAIASIRRNLRQRYPQP